MGVFQPQPGAQERFLSSEADIVVYGGARGGGKTYGVTGEGGRHVDKPGFRAAFFRRTYPQIFQAKGLWDTACRLYPSIGGKGSMNPTPKWTFRTGAEIAYYHMQNMAALENHRGAGYALIVLDELPQFLKEMFLFLLTCLRTEIGIRPYMRCTCNPDPDSWVLDLIRWWIGEDGYPIEERCGVVRWFVVDDEKQFVFADTPEELVDLVPYMFEGVEDPTHIAMSLTFIPARLDDNPALLAEDPGYRGRLRSQGEVERQRQEGGNWLVRHTAGEMFQEGWFGKIQAVPEGLRLVRFWDLAGSDRRRSDFTAGCLIGEKEGRYFVLDCSTIKADPSDTQAHIKRVTAQDRQVYGVGVETVIEQEQGASAGQLIDLYQRTILPGFSVEGELVRGKGDKIKRATPAHSAAKAGNVFVLPGEWTRPFFGELEAFPDSTKDDQVDAFTGGFNYLGESAFAFA